MMNKKGFTLIEILLAVFIFSIIITIVFGSYNFVFSAANHADENIKVCRMASNCLIRMTTDIESLYISMPPEYSPPNFNGDPDQYRIIGSTGYSGNTDFARLRFTSHEHLPVGKNDHHKGLARIVYYVQQKNDDNFVLSRSDILSFSDSEPFEERKSDPVLCNSLISFRLTYFDTKGETYDYWDSESDDFDYSTPGAIGIQLEIAYNNTSRFFATTVYIPVYREKINNL